MLTAASASSGVMRDTTTWYSPPAAALQAGGTRRGHTWLCKLDEGRNCDGGGDGEGDHSKRATLCATLADHLYQHVCRCEAYAKCTNACAAARQCPLAKNHCLPKVWAGYALRTLCLCHTCCRLHIQYTCCTHPPATNTANSTVKPAVRIHEAAAAGRPDDARADGRSTTCIRAAQNSTAQPESAHGSAKAMHTVAPSPAS